MNKVTRSYLYSLMASVVATAAASGILAVMLNDVIRDYGLAGVQEGLMSSLVSVGALLALVATILLQGRVTKVRWIIGGGFLMTLSLVIKSLPMPFVGFLAACLLMGVGLGATDSCQSAFLSDLAGSEGSKYLGALHGVFGLCSFVLPPALNGLLGLMPWRSVYQAVGIAGVLLVAQFAVVTRVVSPQIAAVGHTDARFEWQSFRRHFRNKAFTVLLLSMFFGAAGQSGVIVWTLRYVSAFLHDASMATLCLSLFWVCSTLSRFAAPYLPLSPARVLGYGALVSSAAWALALGFNTPLSFAVACCVAGLSCGPCIPMTLHEGTVLCPGESGVSTSVLMIVKTIAQALAPLTVSLIMSLISMRAAMLVTALFFLLNAVAALAVSALERAKAAA